MVLALIINYFFTSYYPCPIEPLPTVVLISLDNVKNAHLKNMQANKLGYTCHWRQGRPSSHQRQQGNVVNSICPLERPSLRSTTTLTKCQKPNYFL